MLQFAIYLICINVAGVPLMALDKWKAVRHAWRIPEKTLFAVALFGGSLGAWAGMYLFHHKTRHWYFVVGMPAILAVQIIIGVFFLGQILPAMSWW